MYLNQSSLKYLGFIETDYWIDVRLLLKYLLKHRDQQGYGDRIVANKVLGVKHKPLIVVIIDNLKTKTIMKQETFLYVCEGVDLFSANPLIHVDNFTQADIVRNYLKKTIPKLIITYFTTSNKVDVPHFSDYTWNL